MDEFFRTTMGQKYYEGTVPRIARALEGILAELKELNENLRAVKAARPNDEGDNHEDR